MTERKSFWTWHGRERKRKDNVLLRKILWEREPCAPLLCECQGMRMGQIRLKCSVT